MSTISLQGTESKTVPTSTTSVKVSSSDSQPASLEGKEVHDSSTESRTKDTSKEPQGIVDGAAGPLQSSAGPNRTSSQKDTGPGKTLPVNVNTAASKSTPALPSSSKSNTSKPPQFGRADPPHTGLDTTTNSQKDTEPEKTLPVNASTASSKSTPAQPSSSEADTTKPLQFDRADPLRSFTGFDTTTNSQKGTEPEKVVTINTASSESTPALPSSSEVDTSKSPQCTPPQSFNGLDTTRIPPKELNTTPQTTQIKTADVDTPSLTTIPDSLKLKNQCTNGNIDVPTQGSRSQDVKDDTVPVHLPSRAVYSDHSNQEAPYQNEKCGHSTESSEGVSAPSIKEQEKSEANQLPQSEELCGTNKQKASDPTQVQDGQATTPIKEKDVSQQIAKYEEAIRGLKAKLLSMETFASQVARDHRKDIERLEDKITSMEKIVNQQKQEYKEEIESFSTRISTVEKTMNQQKQEYKEEIEYFKARIPTAEAWFSFMERGANTGHKREEGKRNELKLEKEIERLQPKVSSEEDAKQSKTKRARDPTESPDDSEKAFDSSQPPQAEATKHSSAAAIQKINGLDQGSEIKKEQNKSLPGINTPQKQTYTPSPQTVAPKADSQSVTDVANLVKTLNAEIAQAANLLAESLSDLRPPASDNVSGIAFDELRSYIGPRLCDKLRENSEPDPLITLLTLQTGLANACSSVVNDSPVWYNGSILQTLYRKMAENEGQAAADDWKAKASNYLDLPPCEDTNRKHLTEVVRKLATAAVGGTLKGNETLLSQINQQVEVIARMAAKLHKTITEDVTSSELVTFTVSCDTEFDASQMEDSEGNHGSTPCGEVICTQDMGLLYRKRVRPEEPHGSLKDWSVTMKAKVVLAATLEA